MPGFKGLAVPGPTNMPFQVRQAMDIALEDHRAPDFPEFTKPLFEDPDMAPIMQGLLDATPLKRMGQPNEIAQCIEFLLSPAASYVCGSTLFIDGGFDAHTRQDHI